MPKTQSLRTNRPDGRPTNPQKRRKSEAKLQDQLDIQDLRITKKRKSERYERVVSSEFAEKTKDEKFERSILKKLRAIEALLQKPEGTLSEAQEAKCETMDSLIQDLAIVKKRISKKNVVKKPK